MTTSDSDESLPVSHDRLTTCKRSAEFWANHLDVYADRMSTKADSWSIFAGIFAALTAAAIWPVLGDTPTTEEKVIVSLGAMVSALCALVPRVMNYGERAGAARELRSGYGAILGRFTDLLDLDLVTANKYQAEAHRAVTDFQTLKEKKDALRRVGNREEIEAKRQQNWPTWWPWTGRAKLSTTQAELGITQAELGVTQAEVARLAAAERQRRERERDP